MQLGRIRQPAQSLCCLFILFYFINFLLLYSDKLKNKLRAKCCDYNHNFVPPFPQVVEVCLVVRSHQGQFLCTTLCPGVVLHHARALVWLTCSAPRRFLTKGARNFRGVSTNYLMESNLFFLNFSLCPNTNLERQHLCLFSPNTCNIKPT